MSRVWGRLVKATLSNSKKLAKCSERNALIYNFTLTHHDGEGRLEVDDASMLSMCGLFAIEHDWTKGDMAAAREELASAGLWRIYETKGAQVCAEVVDWENAQRLDRIKRGSKILDESEAGGKSDGSSMEASGKSVGHATDKRAIEDKRSETNRREGGEPARARISEEDAVNGGIRAPTSSLSSNRNTAFYQKDAVLAAMARALGQEEFVESNVDEGARIRFAGPIERCPDFDAFLAWAVPPLREKKPIREHWLADVLPLLNDYKPGRVAKAESGLEPATGPPDWWAKAAREAGLR